jgi:hypothetical protein
MNGYGLSAGRRGRRRILRRPTICNNRPDRRRLWRRYPGLVARYGDVPSKRAVPKNGQQLGVAVPKIEHPGAQTRVGIGLRERQICRRILRNDAVWP